MKEILKKYEIFSFLSPADLSALARLGTIKRVNKGDYICHEGERASHFHLVHKGKVKVVKHTAMGRDVILDIFTEGELFLLEPIFDEGEYPASAVATEESEILMLEKRNMMQFMERYPKMMRHALKEMALKLRELNTQVKELSVGKVDYRIANMLLKLNEKIGQDEPGGRRVMSISLSRQDIADFTGTTIETAIRTMSKLAKQDVLKTTKNSIEILDFDRLEEIADGG